MHRPGDHPLASGLRCEANHFILEWDFVRVLDRLVGAGRLPGPAPAFHFERRQSVWEALRAQRRAAVGDVKVQMRLCRIAAVTDQTHYLAVANFVAELDAERPGLQMRVERVVSVADIEDDVIASDRFESDGHRT